MQRLLAVASPPISDAMPVLSEECPSSTAELSAELMQLLWKCNGFYAFESALHVFPADPSRRRVGLCQWNAQTLWRAAYADLADSCFFFAEDLVGGQFCFYEGDVCKFEPETGEKAFVAKTLEEWSARMLDDFEGQTLYPLARDWQRRNGELAPGKRLVPKIPFALGGEYAVDNLYAADAMKAMRFYADLALQIRTLPDGTQVRLKSVE